MQLRYYFYLLFFHRRVFSFSDTDTSDESSDDAEAENGNRASSWEVLRGARLERFTGRLEKRLRLLLVTESGILFNTVVKGKEFIRTVLEDFKLSVPQVLGIIRRRPNPVNN